MDPADLIVLQQHIDHHGKPNPLDGLHAKQLEFVTDMSPRLAGDWGRRSGKTTANGIKIVQIAEDNPAEGTDESIVGYLSTTKTHAKRLMWGRLQTLSKGLNLGYRFQHTELIARAPNGCQIWILGADKETDWDKLRGFPYRAIIIDEAQAIRGTVSSLIDEVLDPALADFDGQLVLTGTPGAACAGFFYEAATGQLPGWSCHHANILNNKFFPVWRKAKDWEQRAKEWLERKRTSKQWDEDHPSYQREWLGRWVRDEGGLVYKYHRQRNAWDGQLPRGYEWKYVLGVDYGHDDPFAMHVWAFCSEHKDLIGVESFAKSGLAVSDWAELIKEWQARYKPVRTVADSGALGKAITKEIVTRHNIPLHAAEKRNKFDYVELMNSDLRAGIIKVDPQGQLAGEWELLQFDESGRLREDERFRNDCSDAALYAWREAQHWINRPKEDKHPIGSAEYADQMAANLRRQRQLNQRKKRRF